MPFISNAAAIAACDTIVDRCDLGSTNASAHIRIYSGAVPTDADTALGAQVLLAELVMTNPAFGNAADLNPGARATAATITEDSVADNTGTATFFRIVDRTGTTVVMQGTAGTSGTDLILNSAAIQANAAVQISALTFTLPES